jgi:hypothetical protein
MTRRGTFLELLFKPPTLTLYLARTRTRLALLGSIANGREALVAEPQNAR